MLLYYGWNTFSRKLLHILFLFPNPLSFYFLVTFSSRTLPHTANTLYHIQNPEIVSRLRAKRYTYARAFEEIDAHKYEQTNTTHTHTHAQMSKIESDALPPHRRRDDVVVGARPVPENAKKKKRPSKHVDFKENHPHWNRIEREMRDILSGKENSSSWVGGLRFKTSDRYRSSLGLGWLLEAHIHAPTKSAYERSEPYRVHLYFPIEYPNRPPVPTYMSIVPHFQIDAMGRPADIFYSDDNLAWTTSPLPGDPSARPKSRRLIRVLRLLRDMLAKPLIEPRPSDADVIRMWTSHGGAARIRQVVGQLMVLDPTHRIFATPDALLKLLETTERPQEELDDAKRVAFANNLRDLYVSAIRPHQHDLLQRHAAARLRTIRTYRPPRRALLRDSVASWLCPSLRTALQERHRRGPNADDAWWKRRVLDSIVTKMYPGVYAFPMLRIDVAKSLVETVADFEASEHDKARPNSMNRLGVVLNDMGFESAFDVVLESVVRPIASVLFRDEGGDSLDHHHSFVVRYDDRDSGLALHTDDSEVTLNVSLCADYDGDGALRFCGMERTPTYRTFLGDCGHRPGVAILHAGRHRHGANRIDAGKRVNLIMWCKSREHRDRLGAVGGGGHDDERGSPDPRCLSRAHDADYAEYAASEAKSGTTDSNKPEIAPPCSRE